MVALAMLGVAPASSRYVFLLLFKSAQVNLLDILSVGDFFFTTVSVGLFLTKDCFDFIVKTTSSVAHVQNLKSLLDSDATFEFLVVHQELD